MNINAYRCSHPIAKLPRTMGGLGMGSVLSDMLPDWMNESWAEATQQAEKDIKEKAADIPGELASLVGSSILKQPEVQQVAQKKAEETATKELADKLMMQLQEAKSALAEATSNPLAFASKHPFMLAGILLPVGFIAYKLLK
jgi:hypothetical protein